MTYNLSKITYWLLILLNTSAFYWLWHSGAINYVWLMDFTYISFGIMAIYWIVLLILGYLILTQEKSTNHFEDRVYIPWWISRKLPILGFIGTVLGFTFMFAGIDLTTLSLENTATVIQFVQLMITSLSTVFLTTLTGLVGHIALQLQLHLFTETVESVDDETDDQN